VNHTFGAEKMDGTLELPTADFYLLNCYITFPAITQSTSQVQSSAWSKFVGLWWVCGLGGACIMSVAAFLLNG
jgi:hypothetical protein